MLDANLDQRVQVCKALLSFMEYGHLWSAEGPTAEAKKYLDQYGGPMSNVQWTLYQFVWHVWGRPSELKVESLMQLPEPYGELVTSLMHATKTGSQAVEAWLSRVKGTLDPESKLRRLA